MQSGKFTFIVPISHRKGVGLEAIMNSKTKRVTLYAVMFAVILVAMTLDRMFSFFNILAFAIFALAATCTFAFAKDNPWDAVAAGFFFGLASNLTAFWFGKTTFYYPWTAILPRLFVGITAYGAYRLMRLILGRMKSVRGREYIALSVAGAIAPLSNTVYTLSCLYFFAKGDPLYIAFVTAFFTNVLPELIITTIATPLLVLGVRRGLGLDITGKPKYKITKKEAAIPLSGANEIKAVIPRPGANEIKNNDTRN